MLKLLRLYMDEYTPTEQLSLLEDMYNDGFEALLITADEQDNGTINLKVKEGDSRAEQAHAEALEFLCPHYVHYWNMLNPLGFRVYYFAPRN